MKRLKMRNKKLIIIFLTIVTGGSAVINTKNWMIELNGQHELYLPSTKVKVGQSWMPGSYNPGLHVRNRYGYAIYQHVQHWISLGIPLLHK